MAVKSRFGGDERARRNDSKMTEFRGYSVARRIILWGACYSQTTSRKSENAVIVSLPSLVSPVKVTKMSSTSEILHGRVH